MRAHALIGRLTRLEVQVPRVCVLRGQGEKAEAKCPYILEAVKTGNFNETIREDMCSPKKKREGASWLLRVHLCQATLNSREN